MSNNLRQQIHDRMNLKETDELLEIWQTNNRAEWSDEAFDVIKSILQERGEVIPEQNEPVYEIEKDEEEVVDNRLEEWEENLLDDEDQPEFYNVLEVVLLRKNINLTAKAVIFVYLVSGLAMLPYFISLFKSIFPGRSDLNLPIYVFAFVLTILGSAVTIAITYFPLKALTHILRILMEMEFRSRKTG